MTQSRGRGKCRTGKWRTWYQMTRVEMEKKQTGLALKEFASHLGDMILQAATAPHANTTLLWEMFKSKIDDGIHTFIPSKTTKVRYSHSWIHILPTRTANSQIYHIPTSLPDYHLHSFYPRTVRDWNILPEAIVTATSFETFKDLISQILVLHRFAVGSRAPTTSRGYKPLFNHFFLHLMRSKEVANFLK